jgi:hypothetical protein
MSCQAQVPLVLYAHRLPKQLMPGDMVLLILGMF